MSSYRKGARFERRVKTYLEIRDWYVIRSAGSKGLVDLIAFHPWGLIMLIACRTDKARYSAVESLRLDQLATKLRMAGLPFRAYLAYREPKPPWTLRLEDISNPNWLVWKPDEEKLPPWHEEEKS